MGLRDCGSSRMHTRAVVIIANSLTTGNILCCIAIIVHDYLYEDASSVDLLNPSLQRRVCIQRLDKFKGEGRAGYRSGHVPLASGFCERTMTYLSPGETGSFLSTSFPPFANMKCPRFVLPCGFFAPSAATRTRSGSDNRGYGNSFCVC